MFPNTERYWIETYGKVALSGEPLQYENYSREIDKYFSVSAYCPKPGQFAVITTDVTEFKRVDRELMEKTEELERFFSLNLDLMCIADMDGNFIRVNKSWHSILGYSQDYLEGKQFMDFVHPADRIGTLNAIAMLERQEQVVDFVNRYQCCDGTYKYIEWRSQPYGNLIYAVARDITEKQEKQRQIEYLSFHDYLTGLYNRRYMEDAINRLDVERNLPFTVMMLDVNGLKLTNDIFGHKMGDRLLKIVADILIQVCRSDD